MERRLSETGRPLWAPWRMQYIESLSAEDPGGCFLCRYRDRPADDARNHVLARGKSVMTLLNRFPYSSGHVLVAPYGHRAGPEDFSADELLEMMTAVRDAKRALQAALGAGGFNIGANLGRCAGAGLPDHMHWHVVPRWDGDTNFMPVLADVKVMPDALDAVFAKVRQALLGASGAG